MLKSAKNGNPNNQRKVNIFASTALYFSKLSVVYAITMFSNDRVFVSLVTGKKSAGQASVMPTDEQSQRESQRSEMPNESPVEPAPNVVVADPYAEFLAEHKKRSGEKESTKAHSSVNTNPIFTSLTLVNNM